MAARERSRGPTNLPAKLIAPRAADAIARARLFRKLDALKAKRLVWVHGRAGSGKTMLLGGYLAARRAPALWYTVDAGDAEPSATYHYARLALEHLIGRVASLPAPLVGGPHSDGAFSARFFEAFFAELPAGTVLVFDDYHEADGASAWNLLFRELARASTTDHRVIVASRLPPPVALASWEGRGELEILDSGELRLDEREVRRFTKVASKDGGLDPDELLRITAGWAVAVMLLAKTRRGRGIHDNTDSLFRFLAGEILDRLDPRSRELLLAVALMPSFTAAMARELTGEPDAAAILERLAGDHLLIERHGEAAHRLHDLFRAFLLGQGRRLVEARTWERRTVHAARLLANDDQLPEAIELLATIEAWEELADLLEQHAPRLAEQGRLSTFQSGAMRLPEGVAANRPWFSFWLATAALGRPGPPALPLGERAFAEMVAANDAAGALLSWALIVQAIVLAGDDFRSLHRWQEELAALPFEPPSPNIAARVALSELLVASYSPHGVTRSLEAVDRALAVISAHGTPDDRIHALGMALLAYYIGGHFERAGEMRRLARAQVEAAGASPLAKIVHFHAEAFLELAHARFHAVAGPVDRGLSLAHTSGMLAWTASIRMLGSTSALARRDFASAERHLDLMSLNSQSRLTRSMHAHGRGWLAFERNDVPAALRWAEDSVRETEQVGFVFGSFQSQLARVIFEGARGDPSSSRRAMEELDRRAAILPDVWQAPADLAKCYCRLGLGEDIASDLRSALARTRSAGFDHISFFGPTAIAKLMTFALEHGLEPELARSLLRAYEIAPGPEALAIPDWPWPFRVRTLGLLEVEIEDQPLEFGRKTPTVLLSLLELLVAAERPVPATRLTSILWPGRSGRAPRGSLDTAVYRLRKLFKADAIIESRNGALLLSPRMCWTDVRALLLWCGRIAQLEETVSIDALERCERALLDLYRGPFAADDELHALVRAREDLRLRFGRAVATLSRQWRRRGAHERADHLAMTALARDEELVLPADPHQA